MTVRRGWPKQMLSDNVTNFVSSSKEIKELVSAIDQDKVQRMTSNKGVTWNWNPPAAPYFGEVYDKVSQMCDSCGTQWRRSKRRGQIISSESDNITDLKLKYVYVWRIS